MDDSSKQFGGTKMFQHLDRLAQWQAGKLPPPVTVELDLTNLCNHACPGCTFSYLVNINKDSIPLDLAHRIIYDLGTIGVRAVTFSGGGEPLVYGQDKVLGLIGLAHRHGMDAALITNGSLLTPDPRWINAQWIRVSLDSYDGETFARFHGRGAGEFAKVVERVRTFAAHKPAGLTFGVGFLTDAGSIDRRDFHRMAEFCAGIRGLDYLQFRPLIVNMVDDPTLSGGGAAIGQEQLAALKAAYTQARAAFARPGYRVLWSGDKYETLAQESFGRTYSRCLAHFLEAVVSADAKVYICCHTQGQERFCLGDLREQSFSDIWHSQRARQVYESFDPRTTCPPACRLHLQNSLLATLVEPVTHQNFI